MRKLVTISFVFLFGLLTAQQLPLVSGYDLHNYLYNPAVAGNKQYVDIRLAHRSQWLGVDGAPSLQILTAQSSIDKQPMGVGGYVFNDMTGIFAATHFGGTYAHHFTLNEEQNTKFSLGLTLSGAQYRIDGNKVELYHSQDNLVEAARASQFNFNGAIGAFLYHEKYTVGLSAVNLIPTKVKYFDVGAAPQVAHYYLTASRNLFFGRVKVQPSTMVHYIPENPIQVDLRVQTEVLGIGYFTAGYRLQDAVVFGLGVDITPDIKLAYFYDLTLSNMQTGNSGSHEVTLSWNLYYNSQYKYLRPRYKWWGNSGEKGEDTLDGGGDDE